MTQPPPVSTHDPSPAGPDGQAPPAPPGARDRNGYWRRVERQKDEILNVRAEAASRWGALERGIAVAARFLAHPLFIAAELLFHAGWILLNSGIVPGVWPWDPYPFSFLLGLASVQALFIGLLILMHEERDARVGEVREETELQVSLHGERETTRLIRMMLDMQRALGIEVREDAELREMAEPLDPRRLRDRLEERLDEEE